MARKKIKLKKNGNGLYQQLVNPMEKSHGETVKFVGKMTNPPQAIKDLVGEWPFDKKK